MLIRYLLDENVDPVYQEQLLRRRPDLVVWAIGDPGAPAAATDDASILRWCEEKGFVLVTRNRASMPVHLADHLNSGRHVPGILTLHPAMSIGQTVDELLLAAEASLGFDYVDRIEYLPIT
jgi:hypothetical protein